MAKYLLVRSFIIAVTLFAGVFITVVIANQSGQIEASLEKEIQGELKQRFPALFCWGCKPSPEEQAVLDDARRQLADASGLNLPYWPRQFWWTLKALRLDWNEDVRVSSPPGSSYPSQRVKDILLTDLPHTLLLVGPAFLLLFLLGIPLALFLFRHVGSLPDRLVTLLAPVSSIPSWVLGVLLVMIFAVELRLLPVGGLYDVAAPDTWVERAAMIARHAVLPLSAILLSLFFQYAYTWRTFFLLYVDEDYVAFARAKGLPDRLIERRYILRPAASYILTSFALMLITFWQMLIALEKVMNWPGIGRLYIETLPNFLGESFYPGVTSVTLGIVVLFAYLLAVTVLVLDIAYVLVDPRVRFDDGNRSLRLVGRKHTWQMRPVRKRFPGVEPASKAYHVPLSRRALAFAQSIRVGFKTAREVALPVLRQVVRYPSALFGLAVILLLVLGSLYAVTAYPYGRLGQLWYSKMLTGRVYTPRLAQPAWLNVLRRHDEPSTIVLGSQHGTATKTIRPGKSGNDVITLTYAIDYPYGGFPQEIFVYFDADYDAKRPFVSLTWSTPDGRSYNLDGFSVTSAFTYRMDAISPRRFLAENPRWQAWFVSSGNYATPKTWLLFADPATDQPMALPGRYQLELKVATFEQATDLDAELVLIGQVYGVAGTDYMRRDLLVPLMWGMPFALLLGLLGAFVTTFLSMLIAALGVWYGGWVDNLIQRAVDVNMILPVIAICVLVYAYFDVSIWVLLGGIVLLNVFGSPIKSFRAALLTVKTAPYIEAARASGASDLRMIALYLVPRIVPILIPQLITLIPSYVFLEATLGIFNVRSDYPTWGRVVFEALRYGGSYGSRFWVLEPIFLLLLTGLSFAMLGFALERILNPRLREQ